MADRENKWEDMEYSDNEELNQSADGQGYSDEEYSDDEYESNDDSAEEEYEDGDEDSDEYEYEDDDEAPRKGSPVILVLLIILILLAAGGYFAYTKFAGGNNTAENKTQIQQEHVDNNGQNNEFGNNEEMGDFFFNEAGGNENDMMSVGFNENGETNVSTPDENGGEENVATVTEQPNTTENDLSPDDMFSDGDINGEEDNAIMVSYNKAFRLNPFKPPVLQKGEEYSDVNNTDFEIIEPPTTSSPDENLKRLLQTQISGILYDDVSPSAIVQLNGTDQFVKIGDVISGYKIENITRNKVQISYKNNSYVASVGELFTRGYVEKQQAVVNLENKFAGRYRNK